MSSQSFPFDLNRVRSMVDESNLSTNARQFMKDLQHIQERRQTKGQTSQSFNLGQMMTMIQGLIAFYFRLSNNEEILFSRYEYITNVRSSFMICRFLA